MGMNRFVVLYLATFISCAVHHPVYEDQTEYKNENVRIIRNPQIKYEQVHQPHVFSFEASRQQDYLKQMYAQQQMADVTRMVNRNHRSEHHFQQPMVAAVGNNQRTRTGPEEWKPFELELSKQIIRDGQKVDGITNHGAGRKLNWDKDVTVDNKLRNNSAISPINTNTGELRIVALTPNEKNPKIKRTDSLSAQRSIIYVNPNLLKQNSPKSIRETQHMLQGTNLNPENPESQLRVLNELIGKNPNIQLEGLQRLLQETPPENRILAAVKAPQPFQATDQSRISEKVLDIASLQNIPNIQTNQAGSTALKIPQIVNKGSFEDLQKQLNEASKLQVEQVLAQARQEAQAQVEAQHRAIALAQAEAQRVALENFQKSLYAQPTALPLVQQNIQEHTSVPLVKPQNSQAVASPTVISQAAAEENIPVTPYPTRIHSENDVEKQLTPAPPVSSYEETPSHSFSPKELLYYAPNHQHQNVLQAEESPLTQVQVEDVPLHEPKDAGVVPHQAIETEEQQVNSEVDVDIPSVAEQKATPVAYQQIVLESKERESGNQNYLEAEEQVNDDDEFQYAAKYAFGYRIKDVHEGNDFGHEERRNGKSAEGSYHVLLPDGRLQKVHYYADNSGYHARVTYEHVNN